MDKKIPIENDVRRDARSRRWEVAAWIIMAFLASGRIWIELVTVMMQGYYSWIFVGNLIAAYYTEFVVFSSVLMFPFLYRQVFGLLPIEQRRMSARPPVENRENLGKRTSTPAPASHTVRLTHDSKSDEVLFALIQSSTRLADRIFTRAGVYLIVGVTVAFIGLGFFYLQTPAIDRVTASVPATGSDSVTPPNPGGEASDSESGEDSAASIAASLGGLASRFGILFFVEFIAFFFFRQYRSAMEEFRYFESVQRKREEAFVLVRLMKEQDSKVDIDRLIKATESFSTTAGKLGAGVSTELLESKKVTKDEMESVFTSILEKMFQSK